MKGLSLVLLVLSLSASAPAQDSSSVPAPPGIDVIKQSWRKVGQPLALGMDMEEPFAANDRYKDDVRTKEENTRQNAARLRRGEGVEQARTPPRRSSKSSPEPISTLDTSAGTTVYSYSVKVRNTGDKTVRALAWEYVFTDPGTGAEVGRHRYTSQVKIRPGKNGELTGQSVSPPARVVDVRSAGGARDARLAERVEIHRVEYDDGSAWERPRP